MFDTNTVTAYVTERFAFSQNLNGLELAGTKIYYIHTLLVTTGEIGCNTGGKVEVLISYFLPSSVR